MNISRVRPAPSGTDVYGDPAATSETTTPIPGAHAWPTTTTDINGPGRDGITVSLDLWVPAGFDLAPTDLVSVGGVRYRIVGDAGAQAEYRHPFTGWNPGSVVQLARAAG